jgi:hypothetical protein
MTGTHGFLWEVTILATASAFFGLTLWQKLRKPKTLSVAVPFGFAVVLAFVLLIFVRQASGIYRLQHMSVASVSSISYKGRIYRDREQLNAIVGTLRESQWRSTRASAMVEREPFSIQFLDGSDWTMVIGRNRYGPGTIIQMADREFSGGYAFNPALNEALKNR